MFMTLGWWGMAPIVGVTALVGWALGGWGSGPAMITNLLTTAGLALMIAFFVNAISKQSEQRRDALIQLAATRAELAESARQTGVLAERERLARELHDTVAQGFASVVTQLESAEQALERGCPSTSSGHVTSRWRSRAPQPGPSDGPGEPDRDPAERTGVAARPVAGCNPRRRRSIHSSGAGASTPA